MLSQYIKICGGSISKVYFENEIELSYRYSDKNQTNFNHKSSCLTINQIKYSLKTFKLCITNFILFTLFYGVFYVIRLLFLYNFNINYNIWVLAQFLTSLYPLPSICIALCIKKYMRKGIFKMLKFKSCSN